MTKKRSKTAKRKPSSRRRLPRLRPDPAPAANVIPLKVAPPLNPAPLDKVDRAAAELRTIAARDLIDRIAGEVTL